MAENASAQVKGPKPVSAKTRFWYGAGDWAFSTMTNVETYFFNYFLTNVANFAGSVATTIAVITSTVDAALSWIYGGIVNAVKPGKFGRYRTWLVMVPWIVPFLYTFSFLKIGDGPIAYVLVTLGFIISHIVWNLPYVANVTLVSACGGTPEGRAALASSRATWNQIAGITFSYLGPPLATVLGAFLGENYRYAALAFVLGWVMVLGYFVNFLATTGYEEIETSEDLAKKQSKTKASVKDMAKSLFQNPHLCFLIIADIAKFAIRFVPGAVAAYYFQYVANDMKLLPQYILIVNIGAFVGAFLSGFLAKKLTARNTMIYSYVVMAAALIIAYLSYASPWAVIGLMTLTQFGQGICYSLSTALYADTAVYSQWKLGADSRGWIMGLANIPLKVSIIGRSVIVNISLVLVGFNAAAIKAGTQQVTPELQKGITAAFALIPAIILIIGFILLTFGYRLTREKIVQYQAEIDARKASAGN
jgi:GPH family glycoside/pentoside/hexuronide:cation symporter